MNDQLILSPVQASSSVGILRGTWRAMSRPRGAWMGLAISGFLINAAVVLISLYSMQVYDRVLPQFGVATLQVLTTGVLIALAFQFLLQKVRSALTQDMIVEADRYAANRTYEMLTAFPLERHAAGSQHLASLVQGHETIRAFLVAVLSFGVVDLPFAVIFFLAMVYLGGWMAGVPALIFLLLVALGAVQHYRVSALARSRRAVATAKLSYLTESVKNLELIQARGARAFIARWRDIADESVQVDLEARRNIDGTLHVVQAAQSAGYILIVAVGAYQAVTERSLSSGAIVAATILGTRALAPLAALPALMIQGAQALLAARAIDQVLGAPPAQPPGTIERVRIRGAWTIHGLSHRPVHKKVGIYAPHLDIPAGAKVAIIGPAGSGKSTLLRLMAGLHGPHQGGVYLDGMSVNLMSRQSLASLVGYLPQSPSLFAGTLRSNLCTSDQIPDEDVLRVAQAIGLDAVIAGDDRGLELPLGENGAGLSGGQQQLVALARTFLQPAQAYLLDEPTQSLDQTTQSRCLDVLDALAAQGRTVVYATHSVEAVRRADILVAISPDGVVVMRNRAEVQQSLPKEAAAQ